MTQLVAPGKTVSGIPILDAEGGTCASFSPTATTAASEHELTSARVRRDSKRDLLSRRRLRTCSLVFLCPTPFGNLLQCSDCVQYLTRIKNLREAHLSTAVGTVLAAQAKVYAILVVPTQPNAPSPALMHYLSCACWDISVRARCLNLGWVH